MPEHFTLSSGEINNLLRVPTKSLMGRSCGTHFTAEVLVPNYQEQISNHYGSKSTNIQDEHKFAQFGIKITFAEPVELEAYDEEFNLSKDLKELISDFGLVIFENVYFSERQRKEGQHNIFPSLAFHVDRGAKFENQYSLFVRNPFDDIQQYPRQSGTIILSNQVAKLQGEKEDVGEMDMCSRYDLYTKEPVTNYFGKVMAYQGWSAAKGVGEVCVFDNRTVLHASYYNGPKGGYRIGVRYLY